ncbi:unnamed protein product [Dicrocoelium dendriticum]|nr:unnamed protein product [Dicrocoelium dendriticum]
MKPKKSGEDEKGSVAESATLNACTLYVRKLPRCMLVSHLQSLCPISVNAHSHNQTFDRGFKALLSYSKPKSLHEKHIILDVWSMIILKQHSHCEMRVCVWRLRLLERSVRSYGLALRLVFVMVHGV